MSDPPCPHRLRFAQPRPPTPPPTAPNYRPDTKNLVHFMSLAAVTSSDMEGELDTIRFRGTKYAITALEGTGWPQPADLGYLVLTYSTAWLGPTCHYLVKKNNHLVLTRMDMLDPLRDPDATDEIPWRERRTGDTLVASGVGLETKVSGEAVLSEVLAIRQGFCFPNYETEPRFALRFHQGVLVETRQLTG